MPGIRVLIADDHSVVRKGLRTLLELDPELEVAGEARDGAEAVQLARRLQPDVLLMDLLMPVMDGVAATAIIRQELPQIGVLALTSALEDEHIIGALRAGATGYLLKTVEHHELIQAIKAAAVGQVQLSPAVAARLTQDGPRSELPVKLTGRETEVLRLLAAGQTNKEIAQALRIADSSVKTHVTNILSKLGVESRTQAAVYATRVGLIPPATQKS